MHEQLLGMAPTLAVTTDWVGLAAVVGGLLLAMFWIAVATVQSMAKSRERERSRREIAAYIAEGSMTAEEGERLMKAGNNKDDDE